MAFVNEIYRFIAAQFGHPRDNKLYGVRGDAFEEIPESGGNVPVATSEITGTSKLFSDVVQAIVANGVTDAAGRTYGVQLNADGQLVVNVPWVEGTGGTTYTPGNAITIDNNVINHGDTSNLNGLQGTKGIKTITLDEFGHITAITTETYVVPSSGAGQSLPEKTWVGTQAQYDALTKSNDTIYFIL